VTDIALRADSGAITDRGGFESVNLGDSSQDRALRHASGARHCGFRLS